MITKDLASFIISLKYEDIPQDTREKVKLCFLDFLGVALRGSQEKSSLIAHEVFSDMFSDNYQKSFKNRSTIIGHDKGNFVMAGFLNGISAHCLDLDDGHRGAQIHPGCVVIPTALTLAEKYDKTGKQFLEAVVAGYEVAIMLGKIINPYHRNQGFHSTGTVGTVAAAAAACKIIDLNLIKTAHALGLAGTQAAGLLESGHAGTMGKYLHAGRAVESGILSSLMAEKSFTGAHSILEGKEGFLNSMCCDLNHEKLLKNQIKSQLNKFNINDVYLKKYPVCRHIHSTIDSAQGVLQKIHSESIKNDKIRKIMVKTYKIASEHDNYSPYTVESIRQSLPISLAIFLNQGELTLDNIERYCEDPVFKEEILKTAEKITIVMDKNLEELQPQKRPSSVSIKIMDGNNNKKTFEKLTFLPKGEPENPFTPTEIFNKFCTINPDLIHMDFNVIDGIDTCKIRRFMKTFLEN